MTSRSASSGLRSPLLGDADSTAAAAPAAAAAASDPVAPHEEDGDAEDNIWDLVSSHKHVSVDWAETTLSILTTMGWLSLSVITVLPLLALTCSVCAALLALPYLLCKARGAKTEQHFGGQQDDGIALADAVRVSLRVSGPAAAASAPSDPRAAALQRAAREARAHEKAWLQPFSDARFACLHLVKVVMCASRAPGARRGGGRTWAGGR